MLLEHVMVMKGRDQILLKIKAASQSPIDVKALDDLGQKHNYGNEAVDAGLVQIGIGRQSI